MYAFAAAPMKKRYIGKQTELRSRVWKQNSTFSVSEVSHGCKNIICQQNTDLLPCSARPVLLASLILSLRTYNGAASQRRRQINESRVQHGHGSGREPGNYTDTYTF